MIVARTGRRRGRGVEGASAAVCSRDTYRRYIRDAPHPPTAECAAQAGRGKHFDGSIALHKVIWGVLLQVSVECCGVQRIGLSPSWGATN